MRNGLDAILMVIANHKLAHFAPLANNHYHQLVRLIQRKKASA